MSITQYLPKIMDVSYLALKGEVSSVQLWLLASSLICWFGGAHISAIPYISLRHGLLLPVSPHPTQALGLIGHWNIH